LETTGHLRSNVLKDYTKSDNYQKATSNAVRVIPVISPGLLY